MRNRHLAAVLAAALALGASAQAAPLMSPAPAFAAPGQPLVLVGNGNGNGNGNFGKDLNRARERENRSAVRTSRSLERAAQNYAEQMARNGFFSHTAPNGSTAMDRAQAADCKCSAVAENLAMGHRNPRQAFEAWMDSPGHRENMLRRGYSSYGLGRAGDVWVLMLSD